MNTVQLPLCEIGQVEPGKFAFEHTDPVARNTMQRRGVVHEVLQQMQTPVDGGYGTAWLNQNFWMPGNAMRGVIEGLIDNDRRADSIATVTRFALRAYAGVLNAEDHTSLAQAIESAGVGDRAIRQDLDHVTLDATDPRYSRIAGERLADKLQGQDALFLPICQGGLVAGIQTALCYARNTGAQTAVYPIRYSRDDSGDKWPRVNEEEVDLIDAASRTKTIVVYDEDAKSGKTVEDVVRYLDAVVLYGRILGAVSYDQRGRSQDMQGVWWERSIAPNV